MITGVRTVASLRQALADISELEEDIKKFIKDEKEAQELYARLAGKAAKLISLNPAFIKMNSDISGIGRDEKRHESIFARMLVDIQNARARSGAELDERERYAVEMGFPGAQVTGTYGRRWK